MSTRRAAAALGAAALLLVAAGCGSGRSTSDGGSGASGSSSSRWSYGSEYGSVRTLHVDPNATPEPRDGVPPESFQDLSAIYAARFEAMGMRLTRAATIDLPAGTHLQLYVEPAGASTPAEFVSRIVPLTAAIGPEAMATWPNLHSFDVCQEPPPGVDDRPEPTPETVLFMTRDQVAAVDWTSPTLKAIRKAIAASDGGELKVDDALVNDPTWVASAP